MTSPHSMTLATAEGTSLAKRAVMVDGVVTRVDDPRWPRVLTFDTVDVETPDDLLDVLTEAADRDAAPCVVRAEPLCEMGRRAIYDDAEKGPAGMRVVPRRWGGFDLDAVPARGIDPLNEPERAVAWARQCLPPQTRDVTVIWQITASAGKQPDRLRLRLWFLLDRPMLGGQIEAWCRPAIASGWMDPVTFANEVIPHFIAVEIAGNSPDPCPKRWGMIRGETDRVPVPDYALVLPSECDQDDLPIQGGDPDALAQRYGPRLERRRAAAVAEIREEIRAVAAATAGGRHTTYRRAASKIEGLCRYWAIPLDRPRELLEQAYLSTLTPDEARKRERGSTRGVWSWLSRRSHEARR